MADDQKPKTMDINELVRELSKSSTGQGVPPASTGGQSPAPQATKPSFSTSKPPMTPPMTGPMPTTPSLPKPFVPPAPIKPPLPKPTEFPGRAKAPSQEPTPIEAPKPQFSVPPQPITQPKPTPAPTATPPSTTPGVKEYQSSIRTMGEDISKIKQGQQPAGVSIPRKVEQTVPLAPQTAVPKPAMPSPQFKVPSVNLGETQKTGPMAQSKDFSGLKPPSGPSVQGTPKTESGSKIYVPEGGPKAGNRNMLFLGIGALALVAGFSYWFFVLRATVPEIVIETPTPTPTETPTPLSIPQIFGSPTQITLSTTENFLVGLTKKLEQPSWPTKQFTALNVLDQDGNKYPLSKFLGMFSATENVKINLDQQEWAVAAYGQTEKFDQKGIQSVSENTTGRFVILAKTTNPDFLRDAFSAWEIFFNEEAKKAGQTLKSLGFPNPFESKDELFFDNTYKGVSIRYKNFNYPDKSVDYAIVSLSKFGTEYFFIANSRESAHALIDFLQSK